jgi:hypothetical protein
LIYSLALAFLLGFELSYYLLILQTGIVEYFNSDLFTLLPMFVGGVLGTILAGKTWPKIDNPLHKIYIALSLQLALSFLYPNYNTFTLGLLGISVGLMAPLGIYLFKGAYQTKFLLALAIAYTSGTYLFTTSADSRMWMAVSFTSFALLSALILKNYKVQSDTRGGTNSYISYIPLMLWIFLDSNLFETISRHEGLNIWSSYTNIIIIFHLIGLVVAYYIRLEDKKQHIFIALLFLGSYIFSYLEIPLALAIIYPFTISYYNVVVFAALSKEQSLSKLSFMMIFVGWVASGAGLGLALTKILH